MFTRFPILFLNPPWYLSQHLASNCLIRSWNYHLMMIVRLKLPTPQLKTYSSLLLLNHGLKTYLSLKTYLKFHLQSCLTKEHSKPLILVLCLLKYSWDPYNWKGLNVSVSVHHPDEATCTVASSSSSDSNSDLNPDLEGVPHFYHKFSDVFSKKKADTLAPHQDCNLKIEIDETAKLPLDPIYSLSQSGLTTLWEFIDENVANGFIWMSNSPFRAPVLFVKKKDGSLHLCVDFCWLNAITQKDKYPLPLISDLLDSPHKAKIFTKIDLKHAYHHVHIVAGDEWKTAFWTCYGSFEWLVMPVGLTNAPGSFQWFLNTIFADLLDVFVVIYLDDILVYSQDEKEHVTHVSEVLQWLQKNGLYAHGKKCFFHSDSVDYLRHFISPDGLKMDPDKVKVIQNWPEPQKVKDIQSFLGFANFYRCYVYNHSDIVVPLTWLTQKNVPWDFNDSCQLAFLTLKQAFILALVLTHWRPDCLIVVETDASDYTLAAILSLQEPNGELHPVTFLSQTFTLAELNYNVHDKGFLQSMKLSKHGIIILKVLLFLLMLLLTIKIWSIFWLWKCSPGNKLVGLSTFVLLTWLSGFGLVNLEPSPMHLLVVWTSTLKKEEKIMIMLTHAIVDLFSCLINYWPQSELLPYFLQSFMDLFHWMWKSLTKIFFSP